MAYGDQLLAALQAGGDLGHTATSQTSGHFHRLGSITLHNVNQLLAGTGKDGLLLIMKVELVLILFIIKL